MLHLANYCQKSSILDYRDLLANWPGRQLYSPVNLAHWPGRSTLSRRADLVSCSEDYVSNWFTLYGRLTVEQTASVRYKYIY